jgi:hypothetical protein
LIAVIASQLRRSIRVCNSNCDCKFVANVNSQRDSMCALRARRRFAHESDRCLQALDKK